MGDSPLKEYEGEVFDCVIIDGSNIITKNTPTNEGEGRSLSLIRLLKVISKVQNLGWPIYLGMKKGTYRFAISSDNSNLSAEEKDILSELGDRGKLSLIDKKNDDDWLIKAAIDNNGWILSNDRFRKEVKRLAEDESYYLANEINKRRCPIEFVGESPVFLLPVNYKSMSLTKASNSTGSVDSLLKKAGSIGAMVSVDGKIEEIRIPIGKPIGRRLLGEKRIEGIGTVSRVHFIIERIGGELTIMDLGSTNGTHVNGLSIAPNFPFQIEGGKTSEIRAGRLGFTISA